MVLYEFYLTYKCDRYSEMESIQEDRSAWPERMAEINSLIGSCRTSEQYCFFVYRFARGKFFMIAAADTLEPVISSEFEDILFSLLVEIYEIRSLHVHNLCEITRDKFAAIIKQCEMTNYIVEPVVIRELDDFKTFIDSAEFEEFCKDQSNIFWQKCELGLIPDMLKMPHKINIQAANKEDMEMIFLLANHDPDSTVLRKLVNSINPNDYPFIIKFSFASMMGYGLYDDNMMTLGEFREYISK